MLTPTHHAFLRLNHPGRSGSNLVVSPPVTAPAAGGTIAVSYTNATTNSITPYPEGAATIMVREDLNWGVVTSNGLSGGIYNLQVQGTGLALLGM